MPLGLYISVPFCRTKCSYCNFASGVFSRAMYTRYVERVCQEMRQAQATAAALGGHFEAAADSVYLGGGTPTVLPAEHLQRLFACLRERFAVVRDAEITVECAPGSLDERMVETLAACGVNRVSLGVQSMVDGEAAAVGRQHKRATVLDDIARLRAAGISNINLDLIAGLPHQTEASWGTSLDEVIASGVPHVSVYMLEVDEDSRLGRELIAGGTRYHAHFVPDEDAIADFYVEACRRLNVAGVTQYEISNFARPGAASRHNLKYWTRQPYLGFGVDAHSLLEAAVDTYELLRNESEGPGSAAGGSRPCAVSQADVEAVRFSTSDSLEDYLAGAPLKTTPVSWAEAREEAFFLGLRLNRGVNLQAIALRFGLPEELRDTIAQLWGEGLLEREGEVARLSERGRLLSNEVFQRFLATAPS
ncbi:MAG TPA: radical SAM family heme chaperone HemW [Terriglobales bacterium]|jgi:oxygen-independent coproporphyrinogen III oxidase